MGEQLAAGRALSGFQSEGAPQEVDEGSRVRRVPLADKIFKGRRSLDSNLQRACIAVMSKCQTSQDGDSEEGVYEC